MTAWVRRQICYIGRYGQLEKIRTLGLNKRGRKQNYAYHKRLINWSSKIYVDMPVKSSVLNFALVAAVHCDTENWQGRQKKRTKKTLNI